MTFHQGRHRKGVRCRLSGILYEETLQMRHASLFSGIGGFDLAAQWMGWENVFQVEIDGFCQKVLEKNFPNTKRYGDINQFNGTEWAGKIDILTGGFPCQPFSVAGKRHGKEDDRHLWPEMLRTITEIKPRWIVGENVTGIVELALIDVLTEMESEGYNTETYIIPACAVNAPHRRDRVWIVAHNSNTRIEGVRSEWKDAVYGSGVITNNNNKGLQGSQDKRCFNESGTESNKQPAGLFRSGWKDFPTQPPICGRNDGVPNRVDRIKSLGNAIVPQVAFEIFKAIEHANQNL